MAKTRIPDRGRWYGWVVFSWMLVVLSVIGGAVLVSTSGMMDVPERDLLGNVSWNKEPNILIWGVAIGQALAAALFAVLMSIANSAYENSCDLLRHVVSSGSGQDRGEEPTGIVIERIETHSPLAGVMRPGFRITKVNGHDVSTVEDADQHLRIGTNEFEFYNLDGVLTARRLHARSDRLHIGATP